MKATSACLVLIVTVGCGAELRPTRDAGGVDAGPSNSDASASDAGPRDASDGPPDAAVGLPVRHGFDPEAAARGRRLLHEGGLAQPFLPKLAMENLWLVWDGRPRTGEAYWSMFRARYGLFASEGPYPVGIDEANGTHLSLNCLVCHANVVAGELIIGVGNDRFDLQGLFDDLVALNERAPMPVVLPYTIEDKTGAAGANDAFGLGMELSELYGPPNGNLNTQYGFQQAPAWWTMRFKDRIYTDGSGQTTGYRPMMATMLAFGLSYPELQAMDADFDDLHDYLLSLEAPRWPFDAPEDAAVERGRATYEATCARCHGSLGADAAYPDLVVGLSEIGTDPIRSERFTSAEATWINRSWFGEVPMSATEGYLAPPLVGVWATAPYFHNGSVPTLGGVLDPSSRPPRWRRAGFERADYDPAAVGWRVQVADATDGDTIEGRKVYDTTRPGLSNVGHDFGAGLSAAERSDLLDFLKTL